MKIQKIQLYMLLAAMLCGTATGSFAQEKAQEPAFAGTDDDVRLPMLASEKQRYITGAVSAADAETCTRYPSSSFGNTLQGKLMGLSVIMNAGSGVSMFIRGHHRGDANGIITLVDGVERDIDDLLPEEIEAVEVIKDATGKILYGARAANGVLLITTKRGKAGAKTFRIGYESGIGLPAHHPEYLHSYDYARLYNEARANDGLAPLYSQSDLDGYRNSTGENDFRYPDVDYYDYFLRDYTSYHKATLELSGGNEETQYALVAGYTGERGLPKVGEEPLNSRFQIRGNLDARVNSYLTAFMGISGVFDVKKGGNMDDGQLFSTLSGRRPNEFPLIIPEHYMRGDSLGIPALGASAAVADNLYGTLAYGGRRKDQNVNGKLNLGLKADLGALLEGLSAQGYVTYDNYFYGRESLVTEAATYAQRWALNAAGTEEEVILIQRKKTNITDRQTLSNSYNRRSSAFIGNVSWLRTFDRLHRISAGLHFIAGKAEATGTSQDVKTVNTSFRANYAFNGRYIAEADLALMSSGKFKGDSRHLPTYAGGLGWVISEESFLKNVAGVDYLKIKASAGLLGYDVATPWFSYDNRWNDNGTARINNSVNPGRVTFEQVGNPDLQWEKSLEINAGTEGAFFERKLWAEINYFNEKRFDIVERADASWSSAYGGLYPYTNRGEIRNRGVEAEIRWKDRAGDLLYQIGANVIWSKNEVLVSSQIEYADEYRRQAGRPSDAIFGYVSQGLFGKSISLENHPHQTLGYYGIGDIAYADLNGDNLIDDRDRRMIGNSYPRIQGGITVELSYKGFGLYLLGTAQAGVSTMLNNAYFWNYGENKYSTLALDRYHPQNNPDGSYPRLTATNGTNNFTGSDFWLENTGFFRLKNVELSYTLGYGKPLLPALRQVKLYVRGSNLLTVSKLKDLDPEAINAGISNYPVLKMITAGFSITL
ncbi:MAG: SusC/RagA family TonB-linked outer membrane protein [Tannerella sp.]|jgi:TonB-linked SusC/RagA family outer membrane protein|nr:SusC/RagA family TonB-linked outer membrane protein [Tannerella sp.]